MTAPASVPDVESVRTLLRRVIDPEVGVNIVDLGLVYRIDVTAEEVLIEMTMTSPACPMGDMIMDDIDAVLDGALPENLRVVVKMVWDPPWNPGMMNAEAREHFGWEK
ncbi:metal-sulfur cluster assembly factor [Azoarcus sp. PA01]|nr:metal-sulfur cluster assembly factor [Azoarcus sp. PA01]